MQEIKGITTGQFAFDLSVEPSEKALAYILELGYKVFIQEAINSWERKLAYPDKDGKKQKRPQGFTRKSIPFTPENAEALKKELDLLKMDVSGPEDQEAVFVETGIMDVTTPVLYEGTTYTPKYGEEKQLVKWYLYQEDGKTLKTLKSGEPRTLDTFCAARGIEPVPSVDDWENDNVFLASVKEWLVAEKKKAADAE